MRKKTINQPEEIPVAYAQVAVAPVHLKGADAIAECFGVSRDTVTTWVKNGAPLAYVGRKIQGDYNAIMAWLIASKGQARAKNTNT